MRKNGQITLESALAEAHWLPFPPGHACHDASILMPGFTTAYWMHVHGKCYGTITNWKAKATTNSHDIRDAMQAITPADGMMMARMRGRCQMPIWSRMAIVAYRKQDYKTAEIARAFCCSPRTITNVIRKADFVSLDRRLTEYQRNPPAKRVRPITRIISSCNFKMSASSATGSR